MDKNARREEMQKILRQNPCLTDEDLAKHFSVSSATIRLDRQTLGIPQMRERMEQLVFGHPSEYVEVFTYWISMSVWCRPFPDNI